MKKVDWMFTKNILGREEMKKIMAGSGSCKSDSSCPSYKPCKDSSGNCSDCCVA